MELKDVRRSEARIFEIMCVSNFTPFFPSLDADCNQEEVYRAARGVVQLAVESDSLVLINALNRVEMAKLVDEISRVLRSFSRSIFSHVWRDGGGVVVYVTPPSGLGPLLLRDVLCTGVDRVWLGVRLFFGLPPLFLCFGPGCWACLCCLVF